MSCVNKATTIAGWDEAHKISEFYMCHHDDALIWWESLEDNTEINLKVW
jgi:hypothetical protein